jgi:hypothetical protein
MEDRRMLTTLMSLSDYGIDPYSLPVHPDVTTFDNPANHIVGTGIGLDGVVELIIDDTFLCTGTLLPTRRHVLTAAHCIDGATSVDVNFHLAGSVQTFTVMDDNLFLHPNFNGDPRFGADIGIIELDAGAPEGVASFDIRRAAFTQISVVAGYGVAGQGIEQFLDGNKRNGSNRYEAFFDAAQTMIMYDFDNGTSANDSLGISNSDLINTGLGNDEVLGVSGDSGGPVFLNGEVVGVHSFRTTLTGGAGDSNPGINGSFGELSVDGLTPANAEFIDSIIVDQPNAPRITELLLKGAGWTRDPYSYAEIVPTGAQLAPIMTGGINQIQIQFNEHVLVNANHLQLIGSTQGDGFAGLGPNIIPHTGFDYDQPTRTATWTFPELARDKYRIELSTAVTDVAGNALDGDWENDTNGTPDDFTDDEPDRMFLTGDGTAGAPNNRFELWFSLLPGDYNQDGYVNAADYTTWQNAYSGTAPGPADGNGDWAAFENPSAFTRSLDTCNERGGRDAEGVAEAEQSIEGRRHSIVFKPADERAVDLGFEGKLLLRHAGLKPGLFKDIAKHAGQFSCLAA